MARDTYIPCLLTALVILSLFVFSAPRIVTVRCTCAVVPSNNHQYSSVLCQTSTDFQFEVELWTRKHSCWHLAQRFDLALRTTVNSLLPVRMPWSCTRIYNFNQKIQLAGEEDAKPLQRRRSIRKLCFIMLSLSMQLHGQLLLGSESALFGMPKERHLVSKWLKILAILVHQHLECLPVSKYNTGPL